MLSLVLALTAALGIAQPPATAPTPPAPKASAPAKIGERQLKPDAPEHVKRFWEECQRRMPTTTEGLRDRIKEERAVLQKLNAAPINKQTDSARHADGSWSFRSQFAKNRAIDEANARIEVLQTRIRTPEGRRALDTPHVVDLKGFNSTAATGNIGSVAVLEVVRVLGPEEALVYISIPFQKDIDLDRPSGRVRRPEAASEWEESRAIPQHWRSAKRFVIRGPFISGWVDKQLVKTTDLFELKSPVTVADGAGAVVLELAKFDLGAFVQPRP